MTTYTARFRTEANWAPKTFEADTPKQALALARTFLDTCDEALPFQGYDCDCPINEIEISGPEGRWLAVWQDADVRLRLAAPDLLIALKQALMALNASPLFPVPSLNSNSYRIAAICERAIAKTEPPPNCGDATGEQDDRRYILSQMLKLFALCQERNIHLPDLYREAERIADPEMG